jgi:hypothetical protein
MKIKGQAAMEFLMTYGWAILAAIIVIGVLAIYFRPSAVAPPSLFVTAPLTAVGSATNGTGISIEIRNSGADTLDIQSANITSLKNPSGPVCVQITKQANVTQGGSTTVFMQCQGTNWVAGKAFSGDLAINYYVSGSTLLQRATGTVSGTIVV